MSDVHEFIKFRFQPETRFDEQATMMQSIGEILADCPGMVRREYFFSERDGQWVAHITWVDEEAIEASAVFSEGPDAVDLIDRLDTTSFYYGRYQLISSQDG